VLTHAHEDHLGAVSYLWPELRCPIYATPFTAAVLRRKLAEAGLADEALVTEVAMSGSFSVGPFEIELVTLTHSIPEPNAVILRCPAGSVLHTGDWKLDPTPLVGEDYDAERLRSLAEEGVLAMVCDSTNALVAGATGSEADVQQALLSLVGRFESRVAIGCFASNIARLHTIGEVAKAHGRRISLVGRSLHRMLDAAQETGYLTDFPSVVPEEEAGYLPRREVLLVCTGSQGEPRSALARIARDDHPHIQLEAGDAVIFSSRVIPGNEKSIFALQNRLVDLGVEVHTDRDHPIHVSGHPARDELIQMYQWVRPKIAIPVHGESRHLHAHAALAAECQVPTTIIAANGSLIRLTPGEPGIVETVESGRLALDGTRLLSAESPVLRARQRMLFNGSATATLVLDRSGSLVGRPQVSSHGVMDIDREPERLDEAAESIVAALGKLTKAQRADDNFVIDVARVAVRRAFNRSLGKKPVTDIHIVRL
jgi:ribonuclease J